MHSGIKQNTLAFGLNMSQQAISQLEQKESINQGLLLEISRYLKLSVESIKNFNDEHAVNIFSILLIMRILEMLNKLEASSIRLTKLFNFTKKKLSFTKEC